VLTVLMLIVAFRFSYLIGPSSPQPLRFDSAAWKQVSPYDGSNVRAAMVDDLLVKHPLRGMSRSDVDLLLGPGDTTGHWQDWDRNFWMRDVMIDCEWLVIRFGADDNILEYAIVQD